MTTIRVTSSHGVRSLCRQSPDGDGVWRGIRFVFDDATRPRDDQGADWLVAYDEPAAGCMTRVPVARRILFITEPPSIKRYPSDYLARFGTVVSPFSQPGYAGRLVRQQAGLGWFYGADIGGAAPAGVSGPLGWSDLVAVNQDAWPRRGLISAVCSAKTMNLNHVRRLRFLRMLKDALGDELVVFGRGFAPIADKAEGIDGFRYHLVLENSLEDNGWTEKLADPILAGVFPIVAGAPNLARDFDPAGFALIDTRRPRAAVRAVRKLLADDPASRAGPAMAANKRRLMEHHNFFAICARLLDDPERAGAPLHPEPVPLPRSKRRSRLRRAFRVPGLVRNPMRRLYLKVMERN
ncbi:MAG: hypothetical protein EPO23_01190 [Xanthobacteraceae bacterium]|nr:MAG: hypothetical protein EPO23_01190 [Xanthobacteraceae bacterium]